MHLCYIYTMGQDYKKLLNKKKKKYCDVKTMGVNIDKMSIMRSLCQIQRILKILLIKNSGISIPLFLLIDVTLLLYYSMYFDKVSRFSGH